MIPAKRVTVPKAPAKGAGKASGPKVPTRKAPERSGRGGKRKTLTGVVKAPAKATEKVVTKDVVTKKAAVAAKTGAKPKTPVKKAASRASTKVPAKTVAAKKASTKKAPAKAPAAKAPAKKASTKKAPAKAPAAKAPAKKASTKKAPAKALVRPASVRAAAVPEQKPSAKKSPIWPYAKDGKFLDEQRVLLHAERTIYQEQAIDLKAEADSLAQEREPGDVQFDEESGEGGTVTVDRERDLALSAQALAAVEEIDEALIRIDNKTYGACERCHQPIPKTRLRALPYARLCVACKSGGLSRR
jgi:RNA polymerase-binding transcription factor DksA